MFLDNVRKPSRSFILSHFGRLKFCRQYPKPNNLWRPTQYVVDTKCVHTSHEAWSYLPQIAKFMGPTWGPPGSCRTRMGAMLAPWTLLSGAACSLDWHHMNVVASRITDNSAVCTTINSGWKQREYQSSYLLALVRLCSLQSHGLVMRRAFPYYDVIIWMTTKCRKSTAKTSERQQILHKTRLPCYQFGNLYNGEQR